jgi:hypothetical protein
MMEGMKEDISGGKPKFPLSLNQTALKTPKINKSRASSASITSQKFGVAAASFAW